jgi:uncharacterized protein YlxW (UPF0749 family)
MTRSVKDDSPSVPVSDGAAPPEPENGGRRPTIQVAVAVACAILGFLLVAQVRATETLGDRLVIEREEDLAAILADITAQSERLQSEIGDLRLLLFEFESAVESEELALLSLQKRLDDLRILTGVVPAESQGVVLTIDDPGGRMRHETLVDIVHEMRNAGAEAIAVNGVRLVASSSFQTRNQRLVVDGQPLESPYRVTAAGPSDELIASGLSIPRGVLYELEQQGITAAVEELEHVMIPARPEAVPFVHGEPVPPEPDNG